MLELICDQDFTWEGLPADRSPYRNHGRAVNTNGSYDGVRPGSGMIRFSQPDSRILINTGPAWRPLTALKIDVLARVNPRAARQGVIVAGDASFTFGLLEGRLEARFNNATGRNNYVRSDSTFSPDQKDHSVPVNKWVRLGVYHDGFARMRLFIEEALVGEAIIEGGVPSAGNLGISIGNHLDQDGLQFPGELDAVRIWRLDPKALKREFLGRPYTPQAALCWQRHAEKVSHWRKENPGLSQLLTQQVRTAQNRFMRQVLLLPDGAQAKLAAIMVVFGELWFAGKLDRPEMEKVLCDWVAVLSKHGINLESNPVSGDIAATLTHFTSDDHDVLKCDPAIRRFLELLRKATTNCVQTTEVTDAR